MNCCNYEADIDFVEPATATFDFLENVAFAATVCNKEGIVLYQNAVARQRDGEVIGKNLYNCHSPKLGEKIRMMMQTGMSDRKQDFVFLLCYFMLFALN